MTMKIHALVIDNNGGTSVSLHASEEQAQAALYLYIAEFWRPFLLERHGPVEKLEREEAINAYFEDSEEWATIQECDYQA
jgi:hypothetical protein